MPFKEPEKKRAYQREYMRKRRTGGRPSANLGLEPVRPHQEQAEPSQFINRSKPYNVEGRYPYPAYLVQDGFWYDPRTGNLVGEVR